ncbi:hypothetical protein HF526_09795 [Pseudonocardia sp. K10HN5]|uniref:Uncharacterized protein n=1 Tax=Pseudonocardia acidicola TaxID=2724939 RepID=A0ABX1SAL1_9PSEU|nr:hypothetical protein [Pseudonocardia acidicola]NMH97602.1 hypothetical protein [Pseudonocardia acidicola]
MPARGEAELDRAVVIVVDEHDVAAGPVEEAGGDAGAISRGAVDPQPPGRELVEALEQILHRDVGGPGDSAGGAFVIASDVEDGFAGFGTGAGGEVGEGDGGVAAEVLARGEVGGTAGRCAGRAVDADTAATRR